MATWPPAIHGDIEAFAIITVGSVASPITDPATARPLTKAGNPINVVYWLCANGVTPVNATGADLVWNAP